jgi:hypothetical protein
MIQLVVIVALTLGLIFIFRALGSWMFRINEVIKELKEINKKLNK